MDTLLQDLRYGFRMLLRKPGFTAVAMLTLALGIGANTAIFSVVNGVLLRPLSYKDADRILTIWESDLKSGKREDGAAPANVFDWRDQNQVFTEMAAFTFAQVNWSTSGESQQVPVQVVSGNYFSLLGAQPALGRGFLPEEDVKATPVVVLSHGSMD